jgi:hypothetical protein
MIMIALCSSLIGAVLGTRFRVQVLFPATAFGILVVAVMAALEGWSVWSAISRFAPDRLSRRPAGPCMHDGGARPLTPAPPLDRAQLIRRPTSQP